LKQQLPKHDQIAKTVVAFANTSGGKLIIGVNDEKQVIGITEIDIFTLQDRIISLISDSCHPTILPEIYTANLDDKVVLVVEIFRGNLLPYFLKQEGKATGTYLRIGASNRPADLDYIRELERQQRHQSFDEEISYEQTLEQLDLTPLQQRFATQGKTLNTEKMQNLKLIHEEQGRPYPTHGLMILLGRYEHVVTKCARFKGTDMSVFIDRKEYAGDLFSQFENTEAFIKNHINLHGEIKGLQRTDTYEIPEVALREALINAYVHRDYTNRGRDIKVGIYDDIVNIVSPGGFPNTLTTSALNEGRSEIRNRVIARIFKELGYIEQWGSGIQRIKKLCLTQGLQEPLIQEKVDFVDVEFYRLKAKTNGTPADNRVKVSDLALKVPDTTEKVPDTHTKIPDTSIKVSDSIGLVSDSIGFITDQENQVIQHLHAHAKITSKDVKDILKLKEARARRLLMQMSEKNLIVKVGTARNTYYVLEEKWRGAQ